MIPVQVAGVSQEFNFHTRKQETFAVFTLRNGHSFRAPVTDETAQILIQLALEQEGPPVSDTMDTALPAPPPAPHVNGANGSAFTEGVAPDGTSARVFGGDVGEPARAPSTPPAWSDAPPTVTAVKPRLIGKDAMGYPIMDAPGGVDPTVTTGTLGEGDEDGVRQA